MTAENTPKAKPIEQLAARIFTFLELSKNCNTKFAKKVGYSNISSLKSSVLKGNISSKALIKIAEALGVELITLVFDCNKHWTDHNHRSYVSSILFPQPKSQNNHEQN